LKAKQRAVRIMSSLSACVLPTVCLTDRDGEKNIYVSFVRWMDKRRINTGVTSTWSSSLAFVARLEIAFT
jgi:hypothetical protein